MCQVFLWKVFLAGSSNHTSYETHVAKSMITQIYGRYGLIRIGTSGSEYFSNWAELMYKLYLLYKLYSITDMHLQSVQRKYHLLNMTIAHSKSNFSKSFQQINVKNIHPGIAGLAAGLCHKICSRSNTTLIVRRKKSV